MGLGSNIFASGNHDSILGNFGKKFQKYTDPIAMIPGVGDKWVNLTSVEIPRMSNTALSKVMIPFEKVDKTINPVRRYVPGVDEIGNVVADKPASALGTAAGAFFGGGALLGGLGAGGAGGGAAAAGGGAGGAGGLGAAGYGGGIGSSVLPGIFEGGTVGTGALGGSGMFGGSLGTGTLAGSSAPLFSSTGFLGSGGAGLFGGNGLSTMQKGQLFQQGINALSPQQDQGTIPVQQNPQMMNFNRPTATVENPDQNQALIRLLLQNR